MNKNETSKRNYSKPELKSLGKIAEKTLGSSSGTSFDQPLNVIAGDDADFNIFS
ncbi:MAG: hypothetical protein AAF498_01860 [Pseudomonadota bacterium]